MSKAIKSKNEIKPVKPKKKKPYAKTNSNAGAKSKLDSVKEEIIKRTLDGCSIKDRCGGIICQATYFEWLSIGNKDSEANLKTEYSEFSELVKESEKTYRDSLRKAIECHALKDWKAMSWLLERSDPETYHLKQKVDVKQEIEVSQKAILEIPDNGRRKLKNSDE